MDLRAQRPSRSVVTRLRLGRAQLALWRPTWAWVRGVVRAFVTSFLALTASLWLLPGVQVERGAESVASLAVLALAIGALLRPLLTRLTVLTGVFGLLVAGLLAQALILWLALSLVPTVRPFTFGEVVLASWAAAVAAACVNWLFDTSSDEAFLGQLLGRAVRRTPEPGTEGPGLLVVQLDGVSEPVLRQAVAAGSMPTLSRWIRSGSHTLRGWHTGIPATTPAAQAALLHGDDRTVPGFRWYDKTRGRLLTMSRPADVTEVEAALSTGDGLLAEGGASVSNIFSGDAEVRRLTLSDARLPTRDSGTASFATTRFGFMRSITLFVGQMITEWHQARRQRMRGVEPRVHRGGAFVLLRPLATVLLRDLNVSMVAEQLTLGAPVVFVRLRRLRRGGPPRRADAARVAADPGEPRPRAQPVRRARARRRPAVRDRRALGPRPGAGRDVPPADRHHAPGRGRRPHDRRGRRRDRRRALGRDLDPGDHARRRRRGRRPGGHPRRADRGPRRPRRTPPARRARQVAARRGGGGLRQPGPPLRARDRGPVDAARRSRACTPSSSTASSSTSTSAWSSPCSATATSPSRTRTGGSTCGPATRAPHQRSGRSCTAATRWRSTAAGPRPTSSTCPRAPTSATSWCSPRTTQRWARWRRSRSWSARTAASAAGRTRPSCSTPATGTLPRETLSGVGLHHVLVGRLAQLGLRAPALVPHVTAVQLVPLMGLITDLAVTWWGHWSATVELGGLRIAVYLLLVDRLAHLRRWGASPDDAACDVDVGRRVAPARRPPARTVLCAGSPPTSRSSVRPGPSGSSHAPAPATSAHSRRAAPSTSSASGSRHRRPTRASDIRSTADQGSRSASGSRPAAAPAGTRATPA